MYEISNGFGDNIQFGNYSAAGEVTYCLRIYRTILRLAANFVRQVENKLYLAQVYATESQILALI